MSSLALTLLYLLAAVLGVQPLLTLVLLERRFAPSLACAREP